MYMVYNSKKKLIYSVISISLVVIICALTILGIMKSNKAKENNEKKQVNDTESINNPDSSILGMIELNNETISNDVVDENMDNSIDNNIITGSSEKTGTSSTSRDDTVNISEENKISSGSTSTTKSSPTSSTAGNGKTLRNDTNVLDGNNKAENTNEKHESNNTNPTALDEQVFEPKIYTIEGAEGKTVYCKLSGTKDAYTDGTYVYKNASGKYVKKEWKTVLNSDGKGVAAFTIPEGATNVKFKILWAGIWNEAGTEAIVKECSMSSYECR